MAKRKVARSGRDDALANTRIVIYAMLAFMTLLALLLMISFNSSQTESAATLEAKADASGLTCAFSAIGSDRGTGGYRFVTVTCKNGDRVFIRSYSAYECGSGGGSYMSVQQLNNCADTKCRLKNMCKDRQVLPTQPPGGGTNPTQPPEDRGLPLPGQKCPTSYTYQINSKCGTPRDCSRQYGLTEASWKCIKPTGYCCKLNPVSRRRQ